MAKAIINAGICGMVTTVTAQEADGQMQVSIDSNCPHYKELEAKLQGLEPYSVCFDKVGQSAVYAACAQTCPHGACPVPTGIVKAIEIAAGLALPRDVVITLSKE